MCNFSFLPDNTNHQRIVSDSYPTNHYQFLLREKTFNLTWLGRCIYWFIAGMGATPYLLQISDFVRRLLLALNKSDPSVLPKTSETLSVDPIQKQDEEDEEVFDIRKCVKEESKMETKEDNKKAAEDKRGISHESDEEIAKKLQKQLIAEHKSNSHRVENDFDEALAQQLQAELDEQSTLNLRSVDLRTINDEALARELQIKLNSGSQPFPKLESQLDPNEEALAKALEKEFFERKQSGAC